MTGDVLHEAEGADGSGRRFSVTREELQRFRAGDRAAGDQLLQRLRPQLDVFVHHRLRRVTNATVRSRLSADDVVQDAMAVAWTKLPTFDCGGPGAMLAWLRAIAEHQVSDHVDHWLMQKRAPAREQVLVDRAASGDGLATGIAARGSGPRTEAEERERSRLMAKALADLEEETQLIVMMRVFYDASWDEIAATASIKSGDAARKRYARALRSLGPTLQGLR